MPTQPSKATSGSSIGLNPAFCPPSASLTSTVSAWPDPALMSKRMPPRYSASAVLMFPIVVCCLLEPVLDFRLRRLIRDLKVHLTRLAAGEERDAFLEPLQRQAMAVEPIYAHLTRRK